MSKNTRTRILLTAVAALLLVVMAVGGTMAWLVDKSEIVTNKFTATDIEITLTEEETDRNFELIPGKEYAKTPIVTVNDAETTVDIWLFVQFDGKTEADKYLNYTSALNVDNGWTLVPDTDNVWYRPVADTANDQSWHLITGDKVTIKPELVKHDGDGALKMPNEFNMVYTAYAIQQEGFPVANIKDAWAAAQGNGVPAN